MSGGPLPRQLAAVSVGLVVIALWVRLPWAWPSYRNIAGVTRDIYVHRNASEAARLETLHGMDWKLLNTARETTPTTARILIPSDPKHGPLASRLWCLYYLYPRTLLYERELTGPLGDQVDYILVDRGWGLALAGFPPDSIRGTETGILEVP